MPPLATGIARQCNVATGQQVTFEMKKAANRGGLLLHLQLCQDFRERLKQA